MVSSWQFSWHPLPECPDRVECLQHAGPDADRHDPQFTVVANDLRYTLEGLYGFLPLSVGERVARMVDDEVRRFRSSCAARSSDGKHGCVLAKDHGGQWHDDGSVSWPVDAGVRHG